MEQEAVKASPTNNAVIAQAKLCEELIDRAESYTAHLADMIARGRGGRETAFAITKLQEAQHWLGSALRELTALVPS